MGKLNQYYYEHHPESCAPDDYWGQVKRTVNGKPVAPEQIEMIVNAAREGLELEKDDVLLDLCCGNGALTRFIFQHCRGGVGVDFSKYLIEVAQRDFEQAPDQTYLLQDVVEFSRLTNDTARFTKAMSYGAFQLLYEESALELLGNLRKRFPALRRIYLGNLPDKALMGNFFYPSAYVPGIENDPNAPTGIWRTEAEFAELVARAGWDACFRRMPPEFHAAGYRYDAILSPAG